MAARGLTEVRRRIAAAAERSGRDPGEVRIVVVTKGRTPEEIMEVYASGHRDFGENRAQELVPKVAALPADVRWHFVGTLQRNKVAKVRPSVTLLHSVDRLRLARAWAAADPCPPVLIQVNIGREPQKHGVAPGGVLDLTGSVAELGIPVAGLMTIAPAAAADSEELHRLFREMAALRERIVVDHPGATELSMGMTDDFETAVAEGATIVRIGRAIFGPRPHGTGG